MLKPATKHGPKRRPAAAPRSRRAPRPPKSLPTHGDEIRIGTKIKHARRVQGMTLQALAETLNCSQSYLSKVEHDKIRPSLSMLHRLMQVLDINIASLFADPQDELAVKIVRATNRPIIRTHSLRHGTGIELERLIADTSGALLEANIHRVEPGASSDGTIQHKGEEIGFVLEGCLELIVEDVVYRVERGDCFFFASAMKHGYRNPTRELTQVLWVCTPPTF